MNRQPGRNRSRARQAFWLGCVSISLIGASGAADEPILGGPCEGCELVFEGQPSTLEWQAELAPSDERGEKMVLSGTVRTMSGEPVTGVVVYAYQTDAQGHYPAGSTGHGRLRAWVRTDSRGRYRFSTIRPGSYPGRSVPQHIHLHVLEPGHGTYYIDDVLFTDDPLLTPAQRRSLTRGRGGDGVVTPERSDGVWEVRRDIVLGARIPGYSPPT